MPQRARLLGPLSGVGCVLLAVATIDFDNAVRAECITQLTQVAPEGTHWSLHTDQLKNRRCWILVEGSRRDVAPPPPDAAQQSTFSSQFSNFIGNFTGGVASPPPQETPGATPASPAPRKPPARVANTNAANTNTSGTGANRPEHPVRTEPKAAQKEKVDGHAGKLEDPAEREALFEEFLRWHESQQLTGGANAPPPR